MDYPIMSGDRTTPQHVTALQVTKWDEPWGLAKTIPMALKEWKATNSFETAKKICANFNIFWDISAWISYFPSPSIPLHFKAGVFPAMQCLKFSALVEFSAVVISHSAWNLHKGHKPKEGILTPEPWNFQEIPNQFESGTFTPMKPNVWRTVGIQM